MDFGMAARAKRKHQVKDRLAGSPVVNGYGAFVATGGVTDSATVAITLQNRFPQSAEILLILPLQRVAGCAQAQGQDLGIPAWTVHHPLSETCHFPTLPGSAFARPM